MEDYEYSKHTVEWGKSGHEGVIADCAEVVGEWRQFAVRTNKVKTS